jgi:hypothetical protein
MKRNFAKQFKPGTFPDQAPFPRGRYYDDSESATAIKKRQGVALGNQVEARPGMVGKQDRSRGKRK